MRTYAHTHTHTHTYPRCSAQPRWAILFLANRLFIPCCGCVKTLLLGDYLLIASEGAVLCCEKSMLGYKTMGSLVAERNCRGDVDYSHFEGGQKKGKAETHGGRDI
jgi:hypothetical protein